MHHPASRLPFVLHTSCMVSYKEDLYKLLLMQVMVAPTIPVSTDSDQGSFGDILTSEELTGLRFMLDIAEADNASLHARIKTMEAVEKVTRNHERQVCIGIEQYLAAVRESRR
ncbi:hypothetical protein Tco_0953763 [Tanacetum coccineum]|uniref:Uncharacterized protein n=1 Tax=Tanacetum coccineum TaxID=301880 RepID=A0ABQ5E2R0_9ASTR